MADTVRPQKAAEMVTANGKQLAEALGRCCTSAPERLRLLGAGDMKNMDRAGREGDAMSAPWNSSKLWAFHSVSFSSCEQKWHRQWATHLWSLYRQQALYWGPSVSILLRDSPVQINWIIGSFHFHKLLFSDFFFTAFGNLYAYLWALSFHWSSSGGSSQG